MVDWQITAKTIYCDAVDDEVTIIVNNDWSVKCTGLEKYATSREASVELVRKSLAIQRTLECQGIDCIRVTQYKEQLLSEETKKELIARSEQRKESLDE